jgi:hypothetical protein
MPISRLTVGRNDKDVFIVLDGRRLFDLGWKAALALAAAIRKQMRVARAWELDNATPLEPEILVCNAIGVRHEMGRILVLHGGALRFDMGWRYAARIWAAIVSKGREAEEWAKADQVALDGAIMFRSGAPIGFTDNPAIQAEIVKEAVHNRDLRRFMPGGVRSEVLLGAPVIKQHSPDADAEVRRLAEKMSPADRRALAAQIAGAEPTA